MATAACESFEDSIIFEESLSKWTGNNESHDEFSPLDLHTAASIGEANMVKELMGKKVKINKLNRGGWSPLMYASYMGHNEVIQLFLRVGADPNQRTPQGSTSLILAAMCGYDSVMTYLIENGASLEAKDDKGWTALFHAVSSGHIATTIFLIKAGARLNIVEPVQYLTPLMEAAACGHLEIVQNLLTQGVDMTCIDTSGNDALKLAHLYGHVEIAQLIEKYRYGHMRGNDFGNRGKEKLVATVSPVAPLQSYGSSGPSIHTGPRAFAEMTGLGADGKPKHGPNTASPLLLNTPAPESSEPPASDQRWDSPKDLSQVLDKIGCIKYLPLFKDQDVDLRIFLTLTENDLKEIGVKLFGPRRKMIAQIGRMNNLVKTNLESGTELGYNDALFLKLKDMEQKLGEAEEKSIGLSTQLAQERQLRSVAEGVLMEQKEFKSAIQRCVDKLLKEHQYLEMTSEKLKLVSKPVQSKGIQYDADFRSGFQRSYDCLMEIQQLLRTFGSPHGTHRQNR